MNFALAILCLSGSAAHCCSLGGLAERFRSWLGQGRLGHIWAQSSFGPLTHLGPNTFGPQLIWAPAHLGPDSFGPQHIWAPTHLGPYSFGPLLIWAPTHLGPNSFGPRHIWAPTYFWALRYFPNFSNFFKSFKFNYKISKSRCFLSHRGIIDKKNSFFYVIYWEIGIFFKI